MSLDDSYESSTARDSERGPVKDHNDRDTERGERARKDTRESELDDGREIRRGTFIPCVLHRPGYGRRPAASR